MADSDKIKRSDVIEDNIFKPTIEEANRLVESLAKAEAGFKAVLKASGQEARMIKVNTVEEVNKLADAIKNVKVAEAALEETKSKKEAAEKKRLQLLEQEKGLIGGIKKEIKELNKLKLSAKTVQDIAKINTELNKAKANLKQLSNIATTSSNTWGKALDSFAFKFNFLGNFLADAAFMAIGAIKDLITGSLNAFREAEVNANKLEFSIRNIAGGNGSAVAKLLEQSEQLQKISIFSDDDIQAAQNMLIQFGLTSDQVEQLIPKVLDLASATGTDLNTASETVIKGINGQMKGLKRVGIDFKDTGDKVQNMNLLMEKLGKFSGFTAEALNTSAGAAKNLDNQINNLQERIGEFINKGLANLKAGLVDVFSGDFNKMASGLTGFFTGGQLNTASSQFALQFEEQTKKITENLKSMALKSTKSQSDALQLNLNLYKESMVRYNNLMKAGLIDEANLMKQRAADLQRNHKEILDSFKQEKNNFEESVSDSQNKFIELTNDYKKQIQDLQISLIEDDNIRDMERLRLEKERRIKEIENSAADAETKKKLISLIEDKFLQDIYELNKKQQEKVTKQLEDELNNRKKLMEQANDEEKKRMDERNKQKQEEEKKRLQNEKDAQKKRIDELIKVEETLTDAIFKGLDERAKRREDNLQNELSAIDNAIKTQQDLAARGLDNTLAFEEKRKADALAKQAELKKKDQRRKEAEDLAEVFLEFLKEEIKNGSSNANARALGYTLSAKALTRIIAGSAYDGVSDTGASGGMDSKGGKLWMLHPHEGVVNRKANEDNPGLVSAMNLGAVDDYVSKNYLPKMVQPKEDKMLRDFNNKLDSLERAVKESGDKVNWDNHDNMIISRIRKGVRTEVVKKKYFS
jgi:hypothetical protein